MSDRILVLVRHGQSEWNLKNLFTGWRDPDLTEQGVAEAKRAGALLKAEGLKFDVAFTSALSRAQRTLGLVLAEIGEQAKVQISDDEVTQALIQRARQFPGQEKEVWEFYRKNPSRAPAHVRRAIEDNEQSLQEQRRAIAIQQEEQARINARFDAEAAHLKSLWAGVAPPPPPAAPAAPEGRHRHSASGGR